MKLSLYFFYLIVLTGCENKNCTYIFSGEIHSFIIYIEQKDATKLIEDPNGNISVEIIDDTIKISNSFEELRDRCSMFKTTNTGDDALSVQEFEKYFDLKVIELVGGDSTSSNGNPIPQYFEIILDRTK